MFLLSFIIIIAALAILFSKKEKKCKSLVKLLVAQLCPTLCDPRDYSPPGSSIHGILQARILEWVIKKA